MRTRLKLNAVARNRSDREWAKPREGAPWRLSIERRGSFEDRQLQVRQERGVRMRELEANAMRTLSGDRTKRLGEATMARVHRGACDGVPRGHNVVGDERFSRGKSQIVPELDDERERVCPRP